MIVPAFCLSIAGRNTWVHRNSVCMLHGAHGCRQTQACFPRSEHSRRSLYKSLPATRSQDCFLVLLSVSNGFRAPESACTWVHRNIVWTFTSKTLFQDAKVNFWMGFQPMMPALFTRQSHRPPASCHRHSCIQLNKELKSIAPMSIYSRLL